jgi:hypothetical protein
MVARGFPDVLKMVHPLALSRYLARKLTVFHGVSLYLNKMNYFID